MAQFSPSGVKSKFMGSTTVLTIKNIGLGSLLLVLIETPRNTRTIIVTCTISCGVPSARDGSMMVTILS